MSTGITSIIADERHQSKAEHEAEHCADEHSVVVNHWHKQTNHQHTHEEQSHADASPPPVLVHLAVYQSLEEECSEDTRL